MALGVRDQQKTNKSAGGAAPPMHDASWVWKGLVCFEASFARLLKKDGKGLGGGGGAAPPFANAMLAAWAWKGLVCCRRCQNES